MVITAILILAVSKIIDSTLYIKNSIIPKN